MFGQLSERRRLLRPRAAGFPVRSEQFAGPRVLERGQQECPKFGHHVGERLESTQLASSGKGTPVCLHTFIADELPGERHDVAVRQRRLSTPERGTNRSRQDLAIEAHARKMGEA